MPKAISYEQTNVTMHIERFLNDLKCVRERIMAMSHCGTAQFTLKLAASADLCPKRSVPPLNPQLGTYHRHRSEGNDGTKHVVQISPLKHRWESKHRRNVGEEAVWVKGANAPSIFFSLIIYIFWLLT
jgi:hypothetical protein